MYRAASPTLLCHSLLPSRTVQEMSNLFKQQTIRKAAGPDNVSSSTLKNCAIELYPVFTHLFERLSLSEHGSCLCYGSDHNSFTKEAQKESIGRLPPGDSDVSGDEGV